MWDSCPHYYLPCSGVGEGKMYSHSPHLLQQTRVLTLLLTSCSTWESGPCTLLGQHSRGDLIGRDIGEPDREHELGKSGPFPICLMVVYGGVCGEPPPLLLCPSEPVTDRPATHEDIEAGELVLSLANC